jgi:hypothetical protein
MKLSSEDVERTLAKFNAEPVPDNHPVIEDLRNNFGDHTFFLHQNRLHIVEPAEAYTEGGPTGRIVRLARWTDGSRESLTPHERVLTNVVVALEEAA